MAGTGGWMRALGTISGILTFLVLLIGLIMVAMAYFQKKNRIALLGAIGFLILFLFSCCSLGWGFADAPLIKQMGGSSVRTYFTVKTVVMFLISLLNLIGFGLVIAALWIGGRKE